MFQMYVCNYVLLLGLWKRRGEPNHASLLYWVLQKTLEAQDTNATRLAMVAAAVEGDGHVIAVGDRRQAIYEYASHGEEPTAPHRRAGLGSAGPA